MNDHATKTKEYALDNVRALLIFAVVFGHLLELCRPFEGQWQIYRVIYSFHMPAFIFLFGYNARFSLRRILLRWCLPYVVYQFLYVAFATWVLGVAQPLQFITPYWLLWYMMVCIFYQLLLPLVGTDDCRLQGLLLGGSVALALLTGFVHEVGYPLSLSRLVVFLPWFLLGHYARRDDLLRRIAERPRARKIANVAALIAAVALTPAVMQMPNTLLFGSYSYAACGGALWMRALAGLMAGAVIVLLFVGLTPWLNRRIPLITGIGQHTWPIFVLHGFVLRGGERVLRQYMNSPWLAAALAAGLVLLLGNRYMGVLADWIGMSWVEKLVDRKLR